MTWICEALSAPLCLSNLLCFCVLNHLWILSSHETFLDPIWTGWPVELQQVTKKKTKAERIREGGKAFGIWQVLQEETRQKNL